MSATLKSLKEDAPCEKNTKRSRKSRRYVSEAIDYFRQGDMTKAFPIFLSYENCEARAMIFLAYMFFEGHGIAQNMDKALAYLHKLVNFEGYRTDEKGILALALYYLGDLYYKGFNVPKDDSEAYRYWLRGANIRKDVSTGLHYYGTVECQSALGMYYSQSKYLDLKKAFMWHKRADKHGNLLSKAAIGIMYLYGIGRNKNINLAYKYLLKASNLGNTFAKGHLAAFYYQRKMFSRALTIGKELASEENLERLAKQQHCDEDLVKKGVAMGCYYLALCLDDRGNSKDNSEAKHLISKALELSPDVSCDLHIRAILGRV